MIRVLVADDHPIIRQGLKQILEENPDIAVTGEANDGQQVLDKIQANDFDVILLDISMPGRSWLDIIKDLKNEKPRLAILILSRHSEEQYVLQALKTGASGYLTKASLVEELIDAIRKVSTGHKYISSDLAEQLIGYFDTDMEKSPHKALSSREFQVLCMIAQGKTMKKIAEELFLSPVTISTYRHRIIEKIQMKSDVELIRYAMEHHLID